MSSITMEDITVHWGSTPDQMDVHMGRWRQAVFQDVAITGDHRLMYFLYDPVADENSGTSGGRKGPASFVLFDTNARKFVAEISLQQLRENEEGVVKFCWLIDDLPSGNASICVVTEQSQYSQTKLMFWSIRLSPDGLSLASAPVPLLGGGPLPVGEDYIVNNREDVAEIVVLTGPGMTVWRIDARSPQAVPVDSFAVAGGDMTKFYDAFIWGGVVYLLSARYDESFDFSTVNVLDLKTRGSPMRTQALMADPMRGFPPARKQAGLALYMGRIYLTGGETEKPDGSFFRFQDVWQLDTGTMQWQQFQCTVPMPLIEPRLTDATGGILYVWGDCDLESGCVAPPTHSHIIKMTGCAQDAPPSYQAASAPPPAYNQPSNPYPVGGTQTAPSAAPPQAHHPYAPPHPQQQYAPPPPQQPTYPQPSTAQGYPNPQGGGDYNKPPMPQPTYPQGNVPGGYPQQQYGPGSQQQQPAYPQSSGGYSNPPQATHPVYPQEEQKKSKKDCSLM